MKTVMEFQGVEFQDGVTEARRESYSQVLEIPRKDQSALILT
jgi:hypothetical protein